MTPISVFIVDDHKVVIDGLIRILQSAGGFRIVGKAASLSEAEVLARKCSPDAVLLDLRLPDSAGYSAIPRMRSSFPRAKIVAITGYGDLARAGALRHGADGFIAKEEASDEIVRLLRALSSGTSGTSEEVNLTRREKQVAELAATGLSNEEIGRCLCIAVNTVKTHLAAVFSKLGVENRVELVHELKQIEEMPK